MIQSIFIMSTDGEVLIERHFRAKTSRAITTFFWEHYNSSSSNFSEVPPILMYNEHTIISIQRDSLIYISVCSNEMPPLLAIEFLHRIADIFHQYFGEPVDDIAIKDNFSTVYQLLEEMIDNGWPLTTEPNALKAMIAPPTVLGKIHQVVTGASNVSDALPDGTISNMPWRKAGVTYAQNEIYVDIVEELDAIVDVNGQVVSSDINGSIQVQSKLSGVPDLTLTFRDPEVIDDCSFHPCVRYNRYDLDRVISFVPPDGNFELMRYRVKNMAQVITPPIFCSPQLSFGGEEKKDGRISVSIGLRGNSSLIFGQKKGATQMVEDVIVIIPFPRVVRTANLTVNFGTVLFDEAKKIARWNVGKITTNRKCTLTGSMVLSGTAEENPPLTVSWSIPNASVSGLSVSGLSIFNESYKPYKGVRCITKSGRFTVRCT